MPIFKKIYQILYHTPYIYTKSTATATAIYLSKKMARVEVESEVDMEDRHTAEVDALELHIKELIKTAPKKGKARDEFETSV